ncbi:MAG TPA: alpha/beta hydrolase family protein [Rhizomicrobium sp.]|jgi:thioesterase domain-containing protein|nr:alpha/beta hydrolase family protein [Rhizomicrobium sp.]
MASISRRATLGAAMVVSAGSLALAQPAPRKTFVLVHGSYHGGWCWRRVADILEAHGHKVYAQSLTGLGDRSHLLSKDINLETHITDIANLVAWENLKDVCLVPHSYAGFPAAGALEHIHNRVGSIVWLDAFIPQNGQKQIDYASAFGRESMLKALARGEFSIKPPPAKAFSTSEKDYAWLEAKMTPHPIGTATQAIRLTGKLEAVARKTFIRVPHYAQPAFDKALAQCQADKSWRTIINQTSGHDVMVDQPEWLADILIRSA